MNKHCAIVGFGTGVGAGIARAFGQAGYRLSLVARTPEKNEAELATLRSAGVTLQIAKADAGDEALLTAALRKLSEPAPIDVLIYNAVSPRMGQPTSLQAADLVADFRVNVAGALTAVHAVLPAMKSHGSGCLLFTGGGWAHYPWAGAASISIGKAALRSLAATLHQELAPAGIPVGIVSIMGPVAAGTAFDPDAIGQAFVRACQAPADEFVHETMFSG